MIAVFGDSITDKYVFGEVTRISPESPIPIFKRLNEKICKGGAANVNENLIALGNKTRFWTSNNSTKTRYVCDNHIIFREDAEEYVPNQNLLEYTLRDVKFCILSDYNKGFLHKSQAIINYCKSKGCKIIVDPKKNLDHYYGADIIKLNEKELAEYSLYEPKDYNQTRKYYNIGALVITLGARGVYISSDEFEGFIETEQHQVADVTGAGDVFIAAMTHFLDKGNSLYDSCKKACQLASISVTKFGTYVLTEEDIAQTRTVFTNGCFDILHRGHIEYLKASKKLGAKLIVGLNSDESVKRLKSENRPINNQNDRKAVLQELSFVDEVIIFDEDTPYDLIKKIKPDIITKGGDYTPDTVIGNELAEVVIIPYIDGYSTTNILERTNDVCD